MLVPFLLFWCLGSFALGEEISRLPLATFASAIVRPLQSIAPAQGQLARGAVAAHPRVVATGVLGDKPSVPYRRTSTKTAHGKTKITARANRAAHANPGTVAVGTQMAARGADANGSWSVQPQWVADAGWAPPGSWTMQWVPVGRVDWAALTRGTANGAISPEEG